MSFTPLRPRFSSPTQESKASPAIPRTPPRTDGRRASGEYSWFYVIGGVVVLSLLCLLAFRWTEVEHRGRVLVLVLHADDDATEQQRLEQLASAAVSWQRVVLLAPGAVDDGRTRRLQSGAAPAESVVVRSAEQLHKAVLASTTVVDDVCVAGSALHQHGVAVAVELRQLGLPCRLIVDRSAAASAPLAEQAALPIVDVAHLVN